MTLTNKDLDIKITNAEFERFRDFFYRKTGIRFEDSKRYFVDKRLVDRVKKTGAHSFRDYFTAMRFQASGAELQELINIMTVNETYFFREAHQFDCMVEELLDEIVTTQQKKELKIWSIPSSTGEEPYSIAIYLMERWPSIERVDIELMSSDIDSSVLEKAKAGIFNERSVQNLGPSLKKKYFTKTEHGLYQATDDLRSCVHFSKVNLNEQKDMQKYRDIDLIFCRNVLIYFDDVSRRNAAEALYDALAPGGFIFLGHSESMSRISSLFKVRKFKEALAYQKPIA
ncbi:CheR family methyltransferase [Marinomonas communis]|jgi:chemotaxis protein methyltransferase CheR|uniref:Chemotaxis protein methyltransferase n=1 Tax=Marinomonas communis TaxID=28254 RepID=A0A4R6XB55_9GAMM|nr:protein-glutamate O-methyltransferase CheR [Marinomonas communis]TDR14744.1 chemotaxis protein methyltransferase CheR [Marinomonas communis]